MKKPSKKKMRQTTITMTFLSDMTTREFCYWLQGYFELDGDLSEGINPHRAKIIRQHLELVFKNVTKEEFPLRKIDLTKAFAKHEEDTRYC